MKEMCRNFICNNNRSPQTSLHDTPSASFATISNVPMNDCNNCVMNRIGLAQAYIPSQTYTPPMPEDQSLICGTVFSELAMPYCSGWNLYRFRREE